ncbi:hypothetical protein D3C76_944870 [compost metagenome]
MHSRGVEPDKERLVRLDCVVHETGRGGQKLLIDGFHALFGQCTKIFDLAVDGAVDYAAWTDHLVDDWTLGPVRVLRPLLGIEVIEVAKELVESVISWQVFVAVPKVVLAELARCIT